MVLQAEEQLPVQVQVQVQLAVQVQLGGQVQVQLEVQVRLAVQVQVQLEGRQVPASAGQEARWVAPHQPGAESVEYLENREEAAVRRRWVAPSMNREMASVGLTAAPGRDRRVDHREASEVLTEASGRDRRVGRRVAPGQDLEGRPPWEVQKVASDRDRPSEA